MPGKRIGDFQLASAVRPACHDEQPPCCLEEPPGEGCHRHNSPAYRGQCGCASSVSKCLSSFHCPACNVCCDGRKLGCQEWLGGCLSAGFDGREIPCCGGVRKADRCCSPCQITKCPSECRVPLFQEPKVKVDQKDSEGTCALMYAAEAGHMHVAGLQKNSCYRFVRRVRTASFKSRIIWFCMLRSSNS